MIVGTIVLSAVIVLGLLWFLFLAPKAGAEIGRMGWYLFSFAAGLTMIVLPCTLPLAFVIVPLSMGKGLAKGLGMALSFGAGVSLMLSLYGVLAALAGKAGLGLLGAQVEDIKNWVYFFAGIFAYVFALGEIGLLKFRMPSYTGSAPDFIQKRKDFVKAFLLGIFGRAPAGGSAGGATRRPAGRGAARRRSTRPEHRRAARPVPQEGAGVRLTAAIVPRPDFSHPP
jgi:cytochrome c-type biogenesis protein